MLNALRQPTLLLAITLAAGLTRIPTDAAEDPGRSPLPPGVHPRLFFQARDLGAIRRRAASPEGQAMVERLRNSAHGGRYNDVVPRLARQDTEWLTEMRWQTDPNGKFSRQVWEAALLYVATDDSRDGLVAVELFRIWLSAGNAGVNAWAAMAYDWLYDLLTEEDRERARACFARGLEHARDAIGKHWWDGGPTPSGRYITNWTAIHASTEIVTNLAIEGEDGYIPDLLPISIGFLREFLTGGISPDGAMFEGTQYAGGYGTKDVPFALIALRRRGLDLAPQANLYELPRWLTYEALPWGYENFALNQSGGRFWCGELLTWLCQERGGLARWVYRNVTPRQEPASGVNPAIGLINGWPTYGGERPDDLPLGKWFSVRGLVFSRSGWGERDASFVVNTTPMGSGHSHADQGAFCLAANGALFAADGRTMKFNSRYHNVVLIDGREQAKEQGGVDVFIRSADVTGYADVVDIDQRLAYDRLLEKSSGPPYYWREVNPVERAERRTVFVRGATGPFVLIADVLRQDAERHAYDWLLHTPKTNAITIEGRAFRFAERFGGKYFEAFERGRTTTLARANVRNGAVRGWLLVRDLPHVHAWSSNPVSVNGREAPYNTTYFGLGSHAAGWRWLSLRPGKEKDPLIPVTDGRLEVELGCGSGGQVALAVFTYREDWTPGDSIPEDGGDFVVLTVDDALESENPWDIRETPKGMLNGLFLGTQPPVLSIRPENKTSNLCLRARRETVEARYLALLAPHDAGDDRRVELAPWGAGQAALIHGKGGTDIVVGAVDGPVDGLVATDAAAATVSLVPDGHTIRGYAMVGGTYLQFDDRELVRAEVALHAVNDGRSLNLRGPGEQTVSLWRGQATNATVNGQAHGVERGETVAVRIPALPQEWQIEISEDGYQVSVVGGGPEPLWIEAPTARRVSVNGIDRYFIRSLDGQRVCPPLALGSPFPYRGEQLPAELVEFATGHARLGDLREVVQASAARAALVAKERVQLQIPIPASGVYDLVGEFLTPTPGVLAVHGCQGARRVELPAAETLQQVRIEDLELAGSEVSLELNGPGLLAVTSIRLEPQYRQLEAPVWSVIGPFPGGRADADVKTFMATVYPPEQETNLQGEYPLPDDTSRCWQQIDTGAAETMGSGVDFKTALGVPRRGGCYAVTFVTAPDDRQVQLGLTCDYWANVFVNGTLVESDRLPSAVEQDGCGFRGNARQHARFALHRGVNTILVKVHGGSGGSSFAAAITDPGDLEFSPTPK